MEIRVRLGDRMKELRYVHKKNVPTVRALEERIDRSRTSISNLLNNEYESVNLRVLAQIAEELSRESGVPISLDDIFELQATPARAVAEERAEYESESA